MDNNKILSELRKRFRKETGKPVADRETIYTYDYTIWLQKELVKKLNIDDVSKKPEIQICYKDNKVCRYNCEGLCKESF